VYAGAVGAGAWREEPSGERTPLHTSTLSQPPDIRLVASKSHRTSRIDAVKRASADHRRDERRQHRPEDRPVSEAVRDLYVYTGGRTKIWDTCGPEAILAGGGRPHDRRRRTPARLRQARPLLTGAASSPRTARCTTSSSRSWCRSSRCRSGARQLPAIIMFEDAETIGHWTEVRVSRSSPSASIPSTARRSSPTR
jgi:3'-phosphoadenosine 5'-phosphosulfate (PAPS) 3'-phosphatase